ncbi:hypothetical protein [Sphingomonas sp.]|uniref:hypothetical protein n=1 Tax=Sphingomonas sp. TaxID=28214 RepID=UPI002ED83B8E
MKIWVRRFATAGIIAALVTVTAWLVLLEILLTLFDPMPMLQLTLPLILALSWAVGWQVIAALKRWAPARQ